MIQGFAKLYCALYEPCIITMLSTKKIIDTAARLTVSKNVILKKITLKHKQDQCDTKRKIANLQSNMKPFVSTSSMSINMINLHANTKFSIIFNI